jgi:beta-mannanase
MLPVITWEPRSTVQTNPDADVSEAEDGYTLASIIDGEHDEYITRYAQQIATLGLPVGIRFAHEMNGPWYPWSEQANGNHRGEYVQAWRHVHDLFTAAGATNAIWIWSPSRINPYPDIDLAPLYPGDAYVDWLGMTGYFRLTDQTPSFARTFDATLAALSDVADKPVLLSEVGATEAGGNKAKKVAWIKDLFAGMAANPQIIGFSWFDQSVGGNDWRIESSSAATAAFAEGVADPRYGAGVWYPR